jgi:hypothetical protein
MSVIVAKLTVVFFAWLNMAVADWPLVAVSVLYIFVGLTNFLNPACPATPVYLTGGIVVGHASEVFFSKSVCTDDLGCASFGDAESCRNSGHGANCQWGGECVRTCQSGFWVGAVYTTITVFLLKLCAIGPPRAPGRGGVEGLHPASASPSSIGFARRIFLR